MNLSNSVGGSWFKKTNYKPFRRSSTGMENIWFTLDKGLWYPLWDAEKNPAADELKIFINWNESFLW